MTLDPDIRETDDEQGFYFHFDRLFLSDIHFGTKHCNAELLNVFLELVQARRTSLGGDILDLIKMKKWNLPDSHREAMARLLQMADTQEKRLDFKPGNHDNALRGRSIETSTGSKKKHNLFGRTVSGIEFSDYEIYTDAKKRRVLHLHGDQFDAEIARDRQGFWYKFFDGAHTLIQEIDWALNKIGIRSRIGPIIKKVFKNKINEKLDYYPRLDEWTRKHKVDVIVHGHAHNIGFETTAAGVLKIDDGCATDNHRIQALGQKKDGTFVTIEMIDGHIRFEDEEGNKKVINLEKLARQRGHARYLATLPRPVPEKYYGMLDNALRPVMRMSPPKKRKKDREKLRENRRALLEHFQKIAPEFNLDASIADKPPVIAVDQALEAVLALPQDVTSAHFANGLGKIYSLAAKIRKQEGKLRKHPIPKYRPEKQDPEEQRLDAA